MSHTQGLVLVVDDDPLDRLRAAKALDGAGFDVVLARSGQEGLEAMREHRPGLVLLDLTMPGLDGLGVLRLREMEPTLFDIPVVVLTGRGDRETRATALAQGALDHLVKPFDREELCLKARNWVRYHQRQLDASLIDALTEVGNRRLFDLRLDEEFRRSRRVPGQHLGVLMMDIDHFKKVNDSCGHQVGDEILRGVARALAQGIRPGDVLARYGGEEFAVIGPGLDEDGMLHMGERLRAAVAGAAMHSQWPACTISIGGACFPTVALDGLVAAADSELYKAKQAGRNCVRCFLGGERATA